MASVLKHLTVVLTLISLVTNEFEDLFICLLAILISSTVKCLNFLSIGLSLFLLICRSFFICSGYKPVIEYMYHKYLLASYLPLHLMVSFDDQSS